jgi:hypothetical protein
MREPQLSAESDVPALVNPDAVDASSLRNEPSEVRLERFTARADPWALVLAVAWLPVLVIPLVTTLHGVIAAVFEVPVTGAGKFIAVALMVTGIGLVGFLTASVTSFFVKEQRSDELDEVKARLNRVLQLLESSASTTSNTPTLTEGAARIEP